MSFINPKIEILYPTSPEFTAKISHFPDDLAFVAQCRHCGGHIRGHLKVKGVGAMKEKAQDAIVLRYLAQKHNCPRKRAQWGEKGLPQKIAPDIMRGFERLQEQALRNKKIGHA